MSYRKSKILNIFLLAVILSSFGGSEFLHHHTNSFDSDAAHKISSLEDNHTAGIHPVNSECPSCVFSHAFKNASSGSNIFDSVIMQVEFCTYTYKFTTKINPYLHENTGLSPPSVS